MSLIVAKIIENEILIVGDTRLTNKLSDLKMLPTEGAIKSIILDHTLSISYAGCYFTAKKILNNLQNEDIDKIVELLLLSNIKSNNKVEYIVASTKLRPRLIIIKNGEVNTSSTGWIGSKNGFELFQKNFLAKERHTDLQFNNTAETKILKIPESFLDNESSEKWNKMKSSMDLVIESSKVPEVGDFTVTLATCNRKFRYHSYSSSFSNQINIPKGLDTFPIPHGTAENGSYTFELLTSENKINFVAFYFLQGKCGIIFNESHRVNCKPDLKANVNPVEFTEYIYGKYNIECLSFYRHQALYSEYGKRKMRENDNEGAIRNFNKCLEIILQKKDNPVSTYINRGITYSKIGQNERALNDFYSALAFDHGCWLAYDCVGVLQYTNKNYYGAIDSFTKAIEINVNKNTLLKRSLVYKLLNDQSKSLDDMNLASKL